MPLTPRERVLTAIHHEEPDRVPIVIGISNATGMAEAGLRDSVKVMVGGAPINDRLAAELGADGYAPDASSATRAAKALLDAAD